MSFFPQKPVHAISPSYLVNGPLYPRSPRPEAGRFLSAPRTAQQRSWLPSPRLSASPRLRRDHCGIRGTEKALRVGGGTVRSDPGTRAKQPMGSPDHAPGHPRLSWTNPTASRPPLCLHSHLPELVSHSPARGHRTRPQDHATFPQPPSAAPTHHPTSWAPGVCPRVTATLLFFPHLPFATRFFLHSLMLPSTEQETQEADGPMPVLCDLAMSLAGWDETGAHVDAVLARSFQGVGASRRARPRAPGAVGALLPTLPSTVAT